MGRPPILDPKLMEKLAKKLGKFSVSGLVSRKAAKLRISSEAALIILCRERGIGTSTFQRRLDPSKRAEIRDALPAVFAPQTRRSSKIAEQARTAKPSINKRASRKLALEYLIEDEELFSRCQSELLASAHFDKAVSQATLVLEERIRNKARLTGLVGEGLINSAFNENLDKTMLRVASGDAGDQRGFTQILRGLVPTFRNKTHHFIIKNFSREEAMRVCGFIDVLLRVVDGATKTK
jgi:uncharacterized protein (TIGR02391 family)